MRGNCSVLPEQAAHKLSTVTNSNTSLVGVCVYVCVSLFLSMILQPCTSMCLSYPEDLINGQSDAAAQSLSEDLVTHHTHPQKPCVKTTRHTHT